jgi:MYXO-CTERM domain-containing protein
MKKVLSVLTLTAFLAFTSPVVHAQTGGDATTTTTTRDDDGDDDDGDSGKWGLLGLLGLAGLLGLKRRDDDNHTRKS